MCKRYHTTSAIYMTEKPFKRMITSIVSSEVPCGTRAMKFCWGSTVTSTIILSSIGKSSFIWYIGGSMLVNVGKRSKRTSSSSQLNTSTKATCGVCTLGVESSPNMVTVSFSPWKWMLSTSYALGASGDRWIDISERVATSLEDEPLSPVFCLFDEGPTSMALFSLFCCRSWNLTRRLVAISSSFVSSIICGTTSSMVSYHSVCFAPNVSFDLIEVSWAWGRTIVFFFVGQEARLEVTREVELGAWCKVHFLRFFLPSV